MATEMKLAMMLLAGLGIGFAFGISFPEPEPKVERVHVPHYQVKTIYVEAPAKCPEPEKCHCIPPSLVLELARQGKAGLLVGEPNITVMQ